VPRSGRGLFTVISHSSEGNEEIHESISQAAELWAENWSRDLSKSEASC